MRAWFKSENHAQPFYLGQSVNQIDATTSTIWVQPGSKIHQWTCKLLKSFRVAELVAVLLSPAVDWLLAITVFPSLCTFRLCSPHPLARLPVQCTNWCSRSNVVWLRTTSLGALRREKLYSECSFTNTLGKVCWPLGATLDAFCLWLWKQEWASEASFSRMVKHCWPVDLQCRPSTYTPAPTPHTAAKRVTWSTGLSNDYKWQRSKKRHAEAEGTHLYCGKFSSAALINYVVRATWSSSKQPGSDIYTSLLQWSLLSL